MKTVTLAEVENYLRKGPRRRLGLDEGIYFINTGALYATNDDEVEDAGSDIKFVYRGVELRRFDQALEQDFQATQFISTADEALEVARALMTLEFVLSTPMELNS